MSEPCPRCGVRADVGCKHQPAEGGLPASLRAQQQEAKRERWNNPNDGRRSNGFNFHRAKQTQSLRGKAGNPSAEEFARNLEAAGRALGLGKRNDG